MSFEIAFPEPKPKVTVETPMMQEIMAVTMANQPTGNMSLWYGNTGIGKTTTAEYLEMKINEAFKRDQTNPNAFRAKHYQVGEIPEWTGNEQKQGIMSVYVAMGVTMSVGEYRFRQAHELADDVVEMAKRKRDKMFFLDEAGCLSLGAIRGIVTIRDRSVKIAWPISFIFIGMDDLPKKLNAIPQIQRRVHPWIYFEEYDFEDTWELLSKLHPHFATLDRGTKEHVAQVKFIHQTFGGYPGLIVPFLSEFDLTLRASRGQVDERLLRSVHYLMTNPKEKSIELSKALHKTWPLRTARKRA